MKTFQKFIDSTDCYITNVFDQKINFALGEEFEIDAGWYQLHLPYTGIKNEFKKIILNGFDLEEIIYTGYCTDGAGKIYQPATAVWDTGGCFTILLHTSIGVLIERLIRCLRNGDLGTNLFEKYTLTVDRPFDIDKNYPTEIRSFFQTSDGPNWWRKDSDFLPYLELPDMDLDKDLLMKECDVLCKYEKEHSPKDKKGQEYIIKSSHPDCIFDLPFVEMDPDQFPTVQKLIDEIGMKRVLSIGVNTLNPGKHFHIHRDSENYSRPGYKYVKGCKIFYWLLTEPKGIHFKFGRCGLLPLDKPLLINPVEYAHSVVNQSGKPRLVISMAGEF